MRKSAQIALIVALMGALACAQGATTPMGEVPAYDDDLGDGDGDGDAEDTGDGDTEDTGDGDGDSFGSGDGDGDGDGDSSSGSDAGAPAPADPLGGIGDFFNQLIGLLGGQPPASGSDAGTP